MHEEQRRDRSVFFWTNLCLSPILIAYGLYDIRNPLFERIAWTEIAAGVILAANSLALRWHKSMPIAKAVVAGMLLLVLGVISPDGGIAGAATNWFILYPIIMFVYLGVGLALAFNLLLVLFTVGLYAGQRQGLFTTYYPSEWYEQLWVVLAASNVLGYAIERAQRKFRDTIVAQRERLRVLLRSLPAGVVMVDRVGKPVAWNDSARVLLGKPVTADTWANRFAEDYGLSREDGQRYDSRALPLTRALREGQPAAAHDIFVPRPGGPPAVLRMSGAPVKDAAGQLHGAVAVFEDDTKEHDIDRMKSEFVSFASHQLKTPLTGIKWSLDALRGGDAGALTPGQQEIAQSMAGLVEGLSGLVGELLDVSRIETGKNFDVRKAPTDLRPVIDKVLADLAPAAAQHGLTLSAAGLPAQLVRDADPDKMRQVFMNLVGNAVKYSKQGGHVSVTLAEDGAIAVIDDGLGIPKAQQARVFERFYRAANVADKVEGTGLGLYIVKAIVEKHGGAIRFESEEGAGTIFSVALPVPAVAAGAGAAGSGTGDSGAAAQPKA